MTAPLSSSADYPAYLRTFQRQQSRSMREMEWEDRLPRRESWLSVMANGFGLLAFLAAVIAFMCVG